MMLSSRLASIAARTASRPPRFSIAELQSSRINRFQVPATTFAGIRWKSNKAPPPKKQQPQEPVDREAQETQEAPQHPQKPLPDLRFGIPSTFEQEYMKDGKTAEGQEQGQEEPDITDAKFGDQKAGGGRGDGEIPKSAYESSIDKRRNRMAQYFYISFALFGTAGALYLGRDWKTEEEAKKFKDAPSGWGFELFYNRIQARIKNQLGYYTEPAFPKLLPIIKDQPMPPYTLVLSLEDMLVHSEWTREHGWRTAKRPGLDFFLLYLSQYYELCLFTSVPSGVADPIYRKLDPYHLIQWPLFREATRYEGGEYIKDLSYLNRPIEKTILLDTKAGHAKAQPENAIVIPPWTGDPQDRDLIALIPFLEYIAVMGIEDIRKPLASFAGTHIPTEFAAREQRMREQYFKDRAAASPAKKSGLRSLADRVVKPGQEQQQQSLVDAMAEGKTLFDVMREEGMKRYRAMEKEVRENGEKWLKEEAELMKRMEAEQMKHMKSNPLSVFGIGAPAKQIDPQEMMKELQREKEAAAAAEKSA